MKKTFSLIPRYLPSARKVFNSIRSSQPRPRAFPLEALGTRQPTRTDEVESPILSLLGNLKRLQVTPDHKPKENYSQIREKSFLFHFAFDLYGSKQLFNLQYRVFVRRARRVAKLTWIQYKTECWIEPVFRENLGGKVQNAFTALPYFTFSLSYFSSKIRHLISDHYVAGAHIPWYMLSATQQPT